jgi:prephenate dehydratase
MTEKVGYLGPPGTFGEQAALRYAPGAVLVPLASNGAVVEAVARGEVDAGLAPVENSIEGAVNDTLDALLQAEGVYVRGELVLPVEQCLIAAPGTSLRDIEVVMSHPQALAQCRAFLEANCPQARLEAALSTAAAVEAAVRTPRAAAIGTRRAAELRGGEVLAAAIQDAKRNKTRFLVLALHDAPPTGDDKTSIAFTVAHDRPGTLMAALREFADRGINLTRIESRPTREELGIYVFLLDLQGHREDPLVAQALAALRAQAHYFRVLGSYPRFQEGDADRGP